MSSDSLGFFRDLREANLRRCEDSYHPLTDWSLTDWATAMGGECGEALNTVKKIRRVAERWMHAGGSVPDDGPVPVGMLAVLADEIADTVIYADLLAARAGIDLAEAIRRKFNEVSERVGSDVHL